MLFSVMSYSNNNYHLIQQSLLENKNLIRLADLRENAQRIADETGAKPLTWQQYRTKDLAVDPRPSSLNAWRGMGIGLCIASLAIVATFLCMSTGDFTQLPSTLTLVTESLAAVVGAGLLGSWIGSHTPHATEQESRKITRYDRYLTAFERSASRSPGITSEVAAPQKTQSLYTERLNNDALQLAAQAR